MACAGLPEVGVGGKTVAFWTFDAGNVLKWDNEAGTSAWLQFCVLPGGPVFLGALHEAGDDAPLPGVPLTWSAAFVTAVLQRGGS